MDINKEKLALEERLMLPISSLDFTDTTCRIISHQENILAEISYEKSDSEINYKLDYKEEDEIWKAVFEENRDKISPLVKKITSMSELVISPKNLNFLEAKTKDDKHLWMIVCQYIDSKWGVDFEISSKMSIMQQELSVIKNQLASHSGNTNNQSDLSSLVKVAIEYGQPIYSEFLRSRREQYKKEVEESFKFEKSELEEISKMDKRDKWYKTVIILICVAALSFLAYYEKAPAVSPVIGVIIGLVLQGNTVADYFSGALKKRRVADGDD